MDCLEYDDNLATVTKNCRGESSCTVYSDAGIARNWTGRSECLQTEMSRKDEFRVKYRCVECDYWPYTVATPSCVRDNLILNFWETEESLVDLSETDLTGLLKENLNKYLNGDAHNMADLNFRDVQGPDSSLCGMASMYRLLVNSFKTKSQLTQYDYSMMKNYLINATQHFATYYYTWSPVDYLDQCKWVACINPPEVMSPHIHINHSHNSSASTRSPAFQSV